jgi:hypothetical protein
VDHARADGRRHERECLGAERLHRLKPLLPTLEQDTDMIDENIRIARGGFDRTRITQIGNSQTAFSACYISQPRAFKAVHAAQVGSYRR